MASYGNCSCDFHPATVDVLGYRLCNPSIFGAWVVAVLIAFICCSFLEKLPSSVAGSISYSVSYFTYGLMISSGLVVHTLYTVECGCHDPTPLWTAFARLDGSLTSSIAMSFFFNALVDAGVMVDSHTSTYVLMLVTYGWIFYAYYNGFYFRSIYFYSIFFGCGSYVIIQLYLIAKRRQWGASVWLIAAGLIGGVCVVLIRFLPCQLCQALGAWSIEGIWYYGSDASMALLFPFIWKTRKLPGFMVTKSKKKSAATGASELNEVVVTSQSSSKPTGSSTISMATKV